MTRPLSLRRTWLVLALAGLAPALVAGCKKETPVETTPPPPPPASAPAPVVLAPLDETDAGGDAEVDAAPVKHATGGLNVNQSRAKQCCNALRAQAKALGASPEAAQLQSIATMCDTVAVQVGATSGAAAPELAPLRALLKGKTIPPLCQGL
jgi:hypothetical protein